MAYAGIGAVLNKTGNAVGALENYLKSEAILEERLKSDPTNVFRQGDLRFVSIDMGRVYKKLAADRQLPLERQIEYWREGRSSLQRGLDIYLDHTKRGLRSSGPLVNPEEVAREIAECDEALARLSQSSSL